MGTGNDVKPATAASAKFTYEDILNFPDDGKRHEIIDGDHYVTPSPDTKHQRIAVNLTVALGSYLKHHTIGELFADDDAVLETPLLQDLRIRLRLVFREDEPETPPNAGPL